VTLVRKSFLLSLADSYLAIALQIASAVVISRLLTPAEVGVFAIAAVFAGLASMFRDFGVAEYLIQERDLTHDKIRATLALNILVSWTMSAALAISASAVSGFYREAGVRDVMLVQALNFLLVPFGAVTLAWFRRELDYVPIVICNALSSIASFGVAIVMAVLGYGYMSLAWSSFAGILVGVAMALWFRPAGFPRMPALRGIGEVFRFSKFASSIYIVAQAGKGAPELIIGRVSGVVDVGMFSRANGLVEIVNRLLMRPVLQICMPYFARSHREGGALVPAYLSSVSLLTSAAWPLLGFVAIAAYPAIRIVYGTQWLSVVTIAQVLCLAMAIDVVHVLSREALMARGEARRANALQIQLVAAQVIGLLVGVPLGLHGAAWGLVGAAAVGAGLSQWHLRRSIGLSLGDVIGSVRGSAALTLLTAVPLAAVAWWVPAGEANFLVWAAGGATFTLAAWLAGMRLLRLRLWDEVRVVGKRLAERMHKRAGIAGDESP